MSLTDTTRRRRRRTTTLGLALFALLLSASAATHAATWDAAAVLEHAEALHTEIGAVLALVPDAPAQETAMQQRTRNAAVVLMKRAHELSDEYVRRLRSGWDRDESQPFFEQVREEVREARRSAGDAVPTEQVAPHLEQIDRLLEQLSSVYRDD